MTLHRRTVIASLLPIASTAGRGWAAPLPTKEDPRLEPMFKSDHVWNAVATTQQGRVFVGYPPATLPAVQVQELVANAAPRPFPDQGWNNWAPGQDPAEGRSAGFVHVNALRIGPDGALWIVDAGATDIGKPAVPNGARIIRVDLSTDRIARIYPLAAGLKSRSYVDDIRFNGDLAYITDAGDPGLIVMDLRTGALRRVLEGHPAATDRRPMYADGRLLKTKAHKELLVQADQLEVSPDGAWLYFQPASGPLARIGTRWLDDPQLPAAELAGHVEMWVDTPTTGGTAIDAQGNLYLSDTNSRSILKITPDRQVSTLIADPRLIWSDAMWIDAQGYLWIPATQQNLTPGFDDGRNEIHYPVWIYRMKIGVGPSPIDHA